MIEANRFKLGLFIISAFIIAFAILLALGMSDLFEKKIVITTIFNESVQGLEQGAPLKLKGVTIGKVKKMTVNLDKKYVRVDMEAILSSVSPDFEGGKYDPKKFQSYIEGEIIKGLRCRLELSGITGMKYVELNYHPPSNPILAISPPEGVLYIPSTPSFLSGISSSFSETMARLASIDYEEISKRLLQTLSSINKLVDNPKIQATIEKIEKTTRNLEKTTDNLNKTLDEAEMKDVVSKLKSNLESLNTLSNSIQKEIENAKIADTTQSARDAFKTTSEGISELASLKNKISLTLIKLNESLDTLTELINTISEDPAVLIKGKRKPELLKENQ
ncbi:MAG TPA: MlaD family protein [Victivallales bacterium]|nr:MlaD family protein [Victivallales bacterium]HPO90238.1 MlaD family protein [Victivallales bacterium]HRR28159.1 MlaD family protein [Victivallales bacterium]HRU00275.1 MlaD family protein [Victivallales bacterium]